MALLPDLVGRVRLDLSDLDRARGEATSRGAAIGSALGTAVGSLAGGLLSAAGAKITDFVSGSIDAFAKLQDATSVTGIKFGDASGSVERFAENAAKSMGASKATALEAANTFATFGQQIDLTGQPLADFSTGMTQLAGDMASFVGTSPQEAIEAIGSAFRGEYDPIEKYGVLLSEQAVKDQAVTMGIAKQGQTLTAHQRILAVQQLILKQTSQAQGDFARTGDSVANTQHRIQAETENAQAALGQRLAPAYLALLNVLNQVIGGVTGFLDVVSNVVGAIWPWRDAIAAVLIVLGILNAQTIAANVAMAAWLVQNTLVRAATTAWTAVQWLLNAALTANPIGLVIAAVAALVAGIIIAYNHSETFRNIVNALWAALQAFFAGVGPAWDTFRTAVVNALTAAYNAVSGFVQFVQNMPANIAAAIGDFAGFVWNLIVGAWTHARDGVVQAVGTHVEEARQFLGKIGAAIGDANKFLWDKIVGAWVYIQSGVANANQYLFDRAREFGGKVIGAIGDFAKMIWDKIVGAWNALPAGIRQPIEQVVGQAVQMAKDILNALVNLPKQMIDMGGQIIDGLLSGLKAKGQQIVDYLTALIPDPVKKALNIASPSKVMESIGVDAMQGLLNGLIKMAPQIKSAMTQVAGTIQQVAEDGTRVAADFYNKIAAPTGANLLKFANSLAPKMFMSGGRLGIDVGQASATTTGILAQLGFKGDPTDNREAMYAPSNINSLIASAAKAAGVNIDARSYGTQLNPIDVVNQILWRAKAGGLVPA